MTTHMHLMQIETLLNLRFSNGQDARSDEYRHGFRAGLERAAGFQPLRNPWPAGTASADAWCAGFEAGRAAWGLAAVRASDLSPAPANSTGEPT